jgi:type II protein arginine methyltransferase
MASPQLSGEFVPQDETPPDDFMPIFYVGHHVSRRQLPISDSVLRRAQDVGVSAEPNR